MAFVSFPSTILQKTNLWRSVIPVTSIQTMNMSWGNTNVRPKRGSHRPNRHWDPKTKGLRAAKVMQIKLPQIEEQRRVTANAKEDPSAIKEYLKKQGKLPTNPNMEYPNYLASTMGALDPYLPPEGEGKATFMGSAKLWAKQKTIDPLEGKRKSIMAVRKIRNFEPEFDPKSFAQQAEQIYIDAHEALAGKRDKKLQELVTETAYPNMKHQTEKVSMYWEFIEALEPPLVKQVRVGEILTADNKFAQVTMRFHTKQILAVYDRFGRLIHGHPHVAKDVIEFVVFEKHIVSIYGKWRLHQKMIPQWLAETREPGVLTHILKEEEMVETVDEVSEKNTEEDDSEVEVIRDKHGKVIREKK